MEEKWIKNEVTVDTYQRGYSTYSHTNLNLKGAIERLSGNQERVLEILERNLHLLSDMRHVYLKSDTLQKREFVRRVFDNNLYPRDGIYRTPAMLKLFTHNALKMKEKGYLIYEKKEGLPDEIPLSGERGITFSDPIFWGASNQKQRTAHFVRRFQFRPVIVQTGLTITGRN